MPFAFCSICKRNNNEGRKHLYTKGHQERLQRLLTRQYETYEKLKVFLKNVHIVRGVNKQPDLDCIFCECEVRPPYKQHLEEMQVACVHIFDHIASKRHRESVTRYFRTHNADRKLMGDFLLSKDDFEQFRSRSKKKESILEKEEQKVRKQDLVQSLQDRGKSARDQSRHIESGQHDTMPMNENSGQLSSWFAPSGDPNALNARSTSSFTEFMESSDNWSTSQQASAYVLASHENLSSSKQETLAAPIGRYTTSQTECEIRRATEVPMGAISMPTIITCDEGAHNFTTRKRPQGSNGGFDDQTAEHKMRTSNMFTTQFTRVIVPPLRFGEKNVFMEGNIPPWLRDDEVVDTNKQTAPEIGPSLHAFLAAKTAEKRKKLNPNRIGADFDRSVTVDPEWLPNFGSVWSSGTHRRSQMRFRRDMTKRKRNQRYSHEFG